MKSLQRWLLVGLFLLVAGPVSAQLSMISGRVFERANEAPMPGVQIALFDADSTIIGGAITGQDGRFRLLNIEVGRYTLVASFVGFKTHREDIRLRINPRDVTIRLESDVIVGEEVRVEAARDQDSSDVRPSVFRITPQQIRQIAGGGDNLIRALQTLPGVLATSDFSNQIIVRGGNPDQNLITIDGIEIFNPYRLNGLTSLFNPLLVNEVELFTGGFPVPFGDRLSSVLAVNTRDGRDDTRFGGRTSVSLSDANLVLEGRTGFGNGTWLISGRRTYYDFFSENYIREGVGINNDIAFPNFYDLQGKVVFRPATGHRIHFQGIYGQDVLDWLVKAELGEQDEDNRQAEDLLDGEDRTQNALIGGAWQYSPSADFSSKVYTHWYRNSGVSDFAGSLLPNDEVNPMATNPPPPVFGQNRLEFSQSQNYSFSKFSIGANALYQRGFQTIEAGAGVDWLSNDLSTDLEVNDFGRNLFAALQSAPNWFGAIADSVGINQQYKRYHVYAQDKVTFGDARFFIQPGLRYDYYEVTNEGYISPRVALSYAFPSSTTIRAAWGQYRQSPGYDKLLSEGDVFELAKFANFNNLEPETATHYILGVTQSLGEIWQLKVEGYYKQLDNLIVQQSGTITRLVGVPSGVSSRALPEGWTVQSQQTFALLPVPINDAKGDAYGLELLLEKRLGPDSDRWSGWVSYSYSKANREQTIQGTRVTFPFDYDRRHALNVVFNTRFGSFLRWNLGVTYRYGSGFPFTPAVGIEPLIGTVTDPNDPNATIDVILTDPTTGFVRFVPTFGETGNVNSERLPDYQRLDLRLTYRTNFFDNNFELYIDFLNVLNRRNVLYYRNIIVNQGTGNIVRPTLFREPVYMLPFLPSVGFSLSF